MEFGEVFRRISGALDAVAVQYMLTGSFASSYHGAIRATQDIDIVIASTPRQLEHLVQHLQKLGYYADREAALAAFLNQSMFNVIDSQTGWKIDFILVKSSPNGLEAFSRRKSTSFQGVPLSMASPEDVIVSKLDGRDSVNPAAKSEMSQLFCNGFWIRSTYSHRKMGQRAETNQPMAGRPTGSRSRTINLLRDIL